MKRESKPERFSKKRGETADGRRYTQIKRGRELAVLTHHKVSQNRGALSIPKSASICAICGNFPHLVCMVTAKSEFLSVRLSIGTKAKLEKIAEAEDRSMLWVVAKILENYLKTGKGL